MQKTIRNFELDLSDIKSAGEIRSFVIFGDPGAEFNFEIKDKDTGKYYNFTTNAFQVSKYVLHAVIDRASKYIGTITFPAITGSTDEYNISILALNDTKHADYNEVRFSDGTLDINSSTGSNSLLLEKVIYQYAAITLTMQGSSLSTSLTGTMATATVATDRGHKKDSSPFSFTCTATTTTAYRILKQPTASDIFTFLTITAGSAPETIPGENIYPTVTGSDTVDGAIGAGVKVVMDQNVADVMKVGDRINTAEYILGGSGGHALDSQVVTVVALNPDGDNVKEFSMSTAVGLADGLGLRFSNQKNYQWPVDNVKNVISGMSLLTGTNVTTDSLVSNYKDTVTIFEDTGQEKIIIKNHQAAVSTKNLKPTVVKGLVTVQPGNIVFDKQQALALASDSLRIGGFGEDQILNVSDYELRFTDLAIALTPPTTTTTAATNTLSTATVADREGVINNVSRVGGIGIDPSVQNPLITSGGGADGAGTWTMDAVQTLENGVTLTVENTSRVATITGNVEIIKAGTSDFTIYFDVDSLLSMSA